MDATKLISFNGLRSTKVKRTKEAEKKAMYGGSKSPDDSYVSNTHKENLCLEYVENFRSNFIRIFPNRNELYLTAKNEFKVEKFVCTTVRPTQLQFRELYDLNKCSEFVAHFLEYEPLENAVDTPSTLPSSTQVLEWGVGDSFDFANLLASFLLGAGYDAYVVHGYAPKHICECNQSNTNYSMVNVDDKADAKDEGGENPQDVQDEIAEEKASVGDDTPTADDGAPDSEEKKDDLLDSAPKSGEYKVKSHGSIESKFLKTQSAAEADSKDAPGAGGAPISKAFTPQPIRWESDDEGEKQVQENEDASSDPLHGKRVHCWVLVRGGKRGVPEMVFIEPSTARVYPVSESPYLGIEAVWNAKNYWVNMQTEKELGSHSYDFANNDIWEYVFIDNGPIALEKKEEGERSMMDMLNDPIGDEEKGEEEEEEDEEAKAGEEEDDVDNILDIPESWVSKLKIDRSKYNIRYPPYGQKVVLYKKAKLELFAENAHDQGMVSRLTIFKDVDRTVVKESVETFVNRRDKLVKRVRNPLERKVHESFDPGRPSSLKYFVEWAGRRREMHFYVNARLDGLLCREEDMGKKIVEKFEGRGDKLTYRSIAVKESMESGNSTFVLPGGTHTPDLVILKMTEKYERNYEKDASDDVAKRTFYVKDNKVRTQYHYASSCITRNTMLHNKGRSADDVGDQLEAVREAEKECLSEARRAQNETADLISTRKHEEQEIVIDQPVFETASARRDLERKVQETEEEKEEGDKRQLDYLTPFLMNIDPKDLTREDALKVKENCLKALKDRLLERANIIQNRLNEENKELAKYQAAFLRNQRDNDPDAEEQFEKECSEAMFRIQILEQRLVQHEESALKKYKDMDNKLVADPRLSVIRHG